MRLNKNLTQKQLAEMAGLARSTVSKLENEGDATLSTLVQVLRALDKLEILNHFITEAPVSPLQIAKLRGKARQRATGGKKGEGKQEEKSNDGRNNHEKGNDEGKKGEEQLRSDTKNEMQEDSEW